MKRVVPRLPSSAFLFELPSYLRHCPRHCPRHYPRHCSPFSLFAPPFLKPLSFTASRAEPSKSEPGDSALREVDFFARHSVFVFGNALSLRMLSVLFCARLFLSAFADISCQDFLSFLLSSVLLNLSGSLFSPLFPFLSVLFFPSSSSSHFASV